MDIVVAENSFYEIHSLLGEGLTSQVYKAFRKDAKGLTRQPVALKIIKSEIHVQVLKKEFEKLICVDSPHCVKVYAWEVLPQGSCLVLELLEGVTLKEYQEHYKLCEQDVNELIAQIQEGLKAIHKQGLIHGDLNFKNILIQPSGEIRLLDFGFYQTAQALMATPDFLAPELWEGCEASPYSDLFSLGIVRECLLSPEPAKYQSSESWQQRNQKYFNKTTLLGKIPEERRFLDLKSTEEQKKEFSSKVKWILAQKKHIGQTQVVSLKLKAKKSRNFFKPVLFAAIFLGVFCFQFRESVAYGEFRFRSQSWAKLSMNGLPFSYSPLSIKKIRKGNYRVRVRGAKFQFRKNIEIKKGQTFLLKP